METTMATSHVSRPRPVWLGFSLALAFFCLTALLWGLSGATLASADPLTFYVDGTAGQNILSCGEVAQPCRTINYTLNNRANDGDTILIAAGTYTENLFLNAITITLRGGYTISGSDWISNTGETVINGNHTDRVFMMFDSNLTLDHLTLTGGHAVGGTGGALYVERGSVLIANSVISDNISFGDGGGLAAYDSAIVVMHDVVVANNQVEATSTSGEAGGLYFRDSAQATLTRLHVYGNTAIEGGGGVYLDDPGTSVTISDSQIYSNTALGAYGNSGGGIGVHQGRLSLSNSEVYGNFAPNSYAGGLFVINGGYLEVFDSTITENTAKDHGGAMYVTSGTADLTNVLITGNSTSSNVGNAIAVDGWGDVTILNSTMANNNPSGDQAVILWSGHLTVTNSILWNSALALQADPPCPTCFTVTYSNVEGGWTGTSNLNLDPHFVAGDDYSLQMDSPCIDTGTNAGAPDHDLDQRPRPLDGNGDGSALTDMGAYEFKLYQLHLPGVMNDYSP